MRLYFNLPLLVGVLLYTPPGDKASNTFIGGWSWFDSCFTVKNAFSADRLKSQTFFH